MVVPVLGIAACAVAPWVAADISTPDLCLAEAVAEPVSTSDHGSISVTRVLSDIFIREVGTEEVAVEPGKALAGRGPRAAHSGSGMVVDV